MAEQTDEWELSKENIQPIQQGRKPGVLKVALAPHPEELILRQRQAFEQELRTYSGNDPLAIWCQYIKWVEQNFPKGGKEGHIEQLIQKCLSVLKDETKYYDDMRFIEIWLKFANISSQPMEIYDYMYSHNIGCKSASFFIAWAWELEQRENIKKANEVLSEGMNRRAEPFEKMKSSFLEFETRIVAKISAGCEQSIEKVEPGRSAFTVLKPQKKNLAPVTRVGNSVESSKTSLTLNKLQPQPKGSTSSGKVPFKIYNSENIAPSLPVQSENVAPFVLHSEKTKENEKRPSKWNKVKVKQQKSCERFAGDVGPGFKFHCDNVPQPATTPRSVPKTSSILSVRKGSESPPMALFEPPDPMKRPMYNKNKVYGGAEEFSLEEIRAAAWFEKKKAIEREQKIAEEEKGLREIMKQKEELQKQVEILAQQVQYLQSNVVISNTDSANTDIKVPSDSGNQLLGSELKQMTLSFEKNATLNTAKASNDICLKPDVQKKNVESIVAVPCINFTSEKFYPESSLKNCNMTNGFQDKQHSSENYNEAANMIQELYNRTLNTTTEATDVLEHKQETTKDVCFPNLDLKVKNSLNYVSPASGLVNHLEQAQQQKQGVIKPLPFSFYHDPTENFLHTRDISSQSGSKEIEAIQQNAANFTDKVLPFPLYRDSTEVSSRVSASCDATPVSKEVTQGRAFISSDQNALCFPNENSDKEDIENIPPADYTQITEKRELAGILQPSKNIFFIPLEEQELQDDAEEETHHEKNTFPSQDETLVPPSNTEQFVAANFTSSTPFTHKKAKEIPVHADVLPADYSNCMDQKHSLPNESQPSVERLKQEAIFPKQTVQVPVKDQNTLPALPHSHLSVIMETSREVYSKSSSSSNSSANLTKSGQFDHHTSHQQSTSRKQISKVGVFKEPNVSGIQKPLDAAFDDRNQKKKTVLIEKDNPSTEIFLVDFDPFDKSLTDKLLQSLTHPVTGFYKHSQSVKNIKIGENVQVGNSVYEIEKLIGEGAYAKVYEAKKISEEGNNYSGLKVAFKVCRNVNEWEIYIVAELHNRLNIKNCPVSVKMSVMTIIDAAKFTDGIIILNEFSSLGTLLDVVNVYKSQNSSVPEYIVMYFTLQILQVVSHMHECCIIHGDIKPDNFLVMKDTSNMFPNEVYLRLIDFGRAIDLNCFKRGICFTEQFSARQFRCNEMKENKPWVFQLDWYGVLNCIHALLFSEYMKVKKDKSGKWEIEMKIKRYWCISLWEPLFKELLNIPSCYKEPDLKPFINLIESKLQQNSKRLKCQMISFLAYRN